MAGAAGRCRARGNPDPVVTRAVGWAARLHRGRAATAAALSVGAGSPGSWSVAAAAQPQKSWARSASGSSGQCMAKPSQKAIQQITRSGLKRATATLSMGWMIVQ